MSEDPADKAEREMREFILERERQALDMHIAAFVLGCVAGAAAAVYLPLLFL